LREDIEGKKTGEIEGKQNPFRSVSNMKNGCVEVKNAWRAKERDSHQYQGSG